MPAPKASNKRRRDAQRAAHLAGGLLIGAHVYLPLVGGPVPQFAAAAVQLVVFPAVVLTGTLMWQMPRLRRLLRRPLEKKRGTGRAAR